MTARVMAGTGSDRGGMEDEDLRLALRSLALFRHILREPPAAALLRLLDAVIGARHPAEKIDRWGEYAASLVPYALSFEAFVHHFLENDVNPCSRAALAGEMLPANLLRMRDEELRVLTACCAVSAPDMQIYLDYARYLPEWSASSPDLCAWYEELLSNVATRGFGVFRDAAMFTLHRGRIVPARNADPVQLSDLQGYEWQKKTIIANTEALLRGKPAADVLLYGDSGTGKSSTIKAVANQYAKDGLRLVEVRPSQLHRLPVLLERLSGSPLKFFLFIDDLSFEREDEDFRTLKGTLEGTVLSRAANVIICATSNRRRLIQENFSERAGDDIHANETVQQKAALSDRFGLAIPFMHPKKDEYLQIVLAAAGRAHVDMPEAELLKGAERFAIEKGGRSGRAAMQYVDQVRSGVL